MNIETVSLLPNSPRTVLNFNEGWLFRKISHKNDPFDDFVPVQLPHDWAIAGPFDRSHDIQTARVYENMDVEPRLLTGRTGALPSVGSGHYRKNFVIPPGLEGKRFFFECDGIMANSQVYLNGNRVGGRPNGYVSCCYEITPWVLLDQENTLEVHAEVKPASSRWYTGGGIYRDVRLIITGQSRFSDYPIQIITHVEGTSARIEVTTSIELKETGPLSIHHSILDQEGREIAVWETIPETATERKTSHTNIESYRTWSLEAPYLYQLCSELKCSDETLDSVVTTFGVRTIQFTAENGFLLNGILTPLQGVCMHHDLGALGAALHPQAVERQLKILQELGCNAIRTAHNPPAPLLLELCDRLGFLVIDEIFDEWREWKVPNGYSTVFAEWAERDLRDTIRRDRNHPCVILWSIGNEIPDQLKSEGGQTARFLHGIAKAEDPSRPTTVGLNHPLAAIKNGIAEAVDVVGINYKPHLYSQIHSDHPHLILYGSETASNVSSRGEYYFPVELDVSKIWDTNQASSYDLSYCRWSQPAEVEFSAQDACSFVAGEFVWTGFDYLGEPSPYEVEWPARSSYFGLIDLCGFPKDRFYLYQSRWSQKPVLHLLPHWTWPDRLGLVTPVHCYSNCDSVELFLNGKSLGKKSPDRTAPVTRYRIRWDEVIYEPGTLTAIGYDRKGITIISTTTRTAQMPNNLKLFAEKKTVKVGDLIFIGLEVTDAEGNFSARAKLPVNFHIEGPGKLLATDNGDPTDTESFSRPNRRTFNGRALAILRAVGPGKIRLQAVCPVLESAEVTIQADQVE